MGDTQKLRASLEELLVRVDPKTPRGAHAAKRIWSELSILKRSSVIAAARSSKPSLLERQAFQRQMGDFQPGERKTTLGLATGHLITSLLQVKLALALATVACEGLALALPQASGSRQEHRLVRTGLRGAVQRLAYYAALLCLSTCVPHLGWALLLGAFVSDPEPLLSGLVPPAPMPIDSRRRLARSALDSIRDLLRNLRPLVQCAEVTLVLLSWYTVFSGNA